MEAAPTTSKVIIQCTDPSNVLGSVEERLATRLPLKSLHWKSPSRPLRSIPALHVSFVRAEGQNGSQSNARRHQIPGLRETPYVKLYLLRCDDKEAYKETARKELKQWIKDNTLEKESKKTLRNQEHHDAYEWMIVHVVSPNTPAASQPKSSKHISVEATDSTDSLNSKSKWTGKSTSTIFDKLRADFGSSKTAVPRVAQVRLTDPARPQTAISPADLEDQWQQLTDDLKQCILKSFDSRVSEYEEDIKERESQRTLPGWNFCTFFILKEGLARGFESVGLLDDALGVYAELDLGLDGLIKDQERFDSDAPGALLPYSKDLKTVIRNALADNISPHLDDTSQKELNLSQMLSMDKDQFPFDVERKHYRDLILSNNVSTFDLRIYTFTRKMEIRLRQAKVAPPGTSAAHLKHGYLDLAICAEVAETSLEFINHASRELRVDLHNAWGGRLSGKERALQRSIIGNIAASWTWTAIMQVLNLLLPATGLSTEKLALEAMSDSSVTTVSVNGDSNEASSEREKAEASSRSSSSTRTSSERVVKRHSQQSKLGLEQVLAWVARLILLARKVIEELPATMTWSLQLDQIDVPGYQSSKKTLHRHSSHMNALSIVNGSTSSSLDESTQEDNLRSLTTAALRSVVKSERHFHGAYQMLSMSAIHLLRLAGNVQTASQVLVDVARLAYNQADRVTAAHYLGQVFTPRSSRSQAHEYALAMYTDCLKTLDRPNEYAQCLLMLVQSDAASAHATQEHCEELIRIADIVQPVSLPLNSIVSIRQVDRTVTPHADKAGFTMSVKLQTPRGSHLILHGRSRLILQVQDQTEPSEIVLEGPQELDLSSGSCLAQFATNTSTHGWYDITAIEVDVGNMHFSHYLIDAGHDRDGQDLRGPRSQAPPVLVYRPSGSVDTEMAPATDIVLGESRRLRLSIILGRWPAAQYSIRLRSATPGLRLLLHDSQLLDSNGEISLAVARVNDVSVITVKCGDSIESACIDIPYTLEHASEPTLAVKAEITYSLDDEVFSMFKTSHVDVLLSVSVNVQDLHRRSHWFSRFLISPSTLVPILLVGCAIDASEEVEVEAPQATTESLMVFPNQPAHWTARLTPTSRQRPSSKIRLALNVRFQCLDELILRSVQTLFAQDCRVANLEPFYAVLVDHLLQRIKTEWTEQDLEVTALTRAVEMWKMKDLDWESILCAFESQKRQTVIQWLTTWHEQRQYIPIGLDLAPVHQLKLFIDLPAHPPLIITSLTLVNATATAPLEQPLFATLSIEVLETEENESGRDYTFDLLAPSDTWLLGGRRKGSIPNTPGITKTSVVLFAQRIGSLLLPVIDIRCRKRAEGNSKAPGAWVEAPVEVHNETVSKTVTITSNVKSTTITLVHEEAQASDAAVLVDRPRFNSSSKAPD